MITSWSPSRLSKWEECPRKAKFEIVQKLCPACFKGKLGGVWGEPQICDTCGKVESVPPAIARGTALHAAAEQFIRYGGKVPADLKNVEKLLKLIRKDFRKGYTTIEEDMVFDADWNPVTKFTKGAWLRTKLDVLTIEDDMAEVIDWKSGGIDKRTGEVRPNPAYDAQLSIYATAVLTTYPKVKQVACVLAFIDGPAGRNEVVSGGLATRKDLPALQRKWTSKAKVMLGDSLFAPNPTIACRWCNFRKSAGGPCSF